MAYKMIYFRDKPEADYGEYLCDIRSDIESLPTDIPVGSTALVTTDTSVWVLNNSKIWVEV